MSLRFRKRVKLLPGIYLNLGRNGISTTIGPRGANINIGKGGVYLNTGIPGTGISNREKLFGGSGNYSNPHLNLPDTVDTIPNNEQEQNPNSTQDITTSQGLVGLQEHLEEAKKERESLAAELKEAENNYSELYSNLSKKQNGFFSKLFTSKETVETLEKKVEEASKDLDELKKEYEESKADININFETDIEEQNKKLNNAFNELLKSRTIWDITTEKANTEIKSWAKSIIERKEVKFKLDSLDFIKSEHQAFHLQNANGSNLFIYPAFVLLIDNQSKINLVDLKELNFRFHLQRFQEQKETVPADTKIIDYAWYKVNQDGSRDMRYAGNYQIPIVQYGAFDFSSSNGLNETYYISNAALAQSFANEFSNYILLLKGEKV